MSKPLWTANVIILLPQIHLCMIYAGFPISDLDIIVKVTEPLEQIRLSTGYKKSFAANVIKSLR